MNKKNSLIYNIPFTFAISIIQTVLSLLPGVLFLKDSSRGPSILFYMIVYLFMSDFFQIIGKTTYKKGKFIASPLYAVKLIVSCILIFLIMQQTAWQFGIVLLAYELFQLLTFSKQFFYLDSIYYSLTNAFFKGIVFNQLLTISYPFDYDFELIKPFLFSFLMILFITILTQGMYSFLEKLAYYFILSIVCLVAIYYLLIHQLSLGDLAGWKLVIFILANLGSLFFFIKSKNPKKKEFILNIFALIGLFIYYL